MIQACLHPVSGAWQNKSPLTAYWMEGFDCKQNKMQKDSIHQISSKGTHIIKWP
jgi:hypothetical protein